MACRRSISTRVTLLARRFHPSFSHIPRAEENDTKSDLPKSSHGICRNLPHGSYYRIGGLGYPIQERAWSRPTGLGSSFCRYMSTTPGEWSDKIDDIGFIPDKVIEVGASQIPAISEVAVAAADSSLPVAALQYVIDGVHSFTGLNWWASIALTTLMIRGITVPVLISQLKATTKLNMLRPHLEALKQDMNNQVIDAPEFQRKMQALFRKYGVSPFTPLKGLLIQGPIFISFFMAIRNMSEKVPSFTTGGALWFTDLTTADTLMILPVLTSLTFWITVECNMQEGLEGNPIAGTMKKFSRILAVVAIPVMMGLPKALFCYWLTSNMFSLAYGLAIRRPDVKKLLNLPEISVSPTPASQSEISLFSGLKENTTFQSEPSQSKPSVVVRRRISPSSIISQRMKSKERQAKTLRQAKKS